MYSHVASLLTDSRFDRTTRRLRLSGWRGDDLRSARRAGARLRFAPAFCAAASIGFALVGEPILLALLAATAAVGAFRGNHVVEELYNLTIGRRGIPIPRARAARAFGCLMGAVMLWGAALAFAAGAPTLGLVLALALGGVAAFVAATAICVPSMLFVLIFGNERAKDASLIHALKPGSFVSAVAPS